MNLGMKLFVKAHVALYRASGGKLGGTLGGQPVILLTTKGRKTGVARTVPLVPFIDGDKVHVMASMAGAPEHPAWFGNMQANPEVEVQRGAERYKARAVVLSDDERSQIWPRITSLMPNFAEYQTKTRRVIPVVRLERIDRA